MKIIFGLGNPGNNFVCSRHNLGFIVLDKIASDHHLVFENQAIFKAQVASWGTDLLLVKPQTFMNQSGQSVRLILKQNPGELIVVHDDVDLNLGEVKCSFARGTGGHNGVQSIIDQIHTNEFFRVRVGVRPIDDRLIDQIAPPHGFENFLLANFTPLEEELKQKGMEKAEKIIEDLSSLDFNQLMTKYN